MRLVRLRAARWAMLGALALFGGCATLPDFDSLRPARPAKSVRVLSAEGVVKNTSTAALVRSVQEAGQSDLLRHHLALMDALGGPPLVAGNEARLLIDGPAAYQAMFASIEGARSHINLETYIFYDDVIGNKLAELLLRKQAQGVQVNVIYDGVGSIKTPPEFFRQMRDAGIRTVEFNPINPLAGKTLSLNHRDHRKMLIVDGRVAYTGGINISSVYSSGSSAPRRRRQEPDLKDGWRDTQIELRGPAVAEFQKLFADTWTQQKGEPLPPREYFPRLERQSNKLVRVIGSSPADAINLIYIELLSAISSAERSVHLTMAYFVPDEQVMKALREAAQRGVDVTLILPGLSDFKVVLEAGRSYYADLLDSGVKIYERRDAMLHAKTAVIDGVWATVGSANMDMRSFLHNNEVNAVVLGEEFGAQMESMFRTDLVRCTPITRESWASRPAGERLKEWLARMWQYWL